MADGAFCTAGKECISGSCVDSVCCNTACDGTCTACNLTGSVGYCTAIPAGQDPADECPSVSCAAYYWGWVGDSCYRKADVSGAKAACRGDGVCYSTAEECSLSTTPGPAVLTCNSLCQEPSLATCAGTTAGSCENVNLGDQTCGVGACKRSVPVCANGCPVVCQPGTPTFEWCNNIDDDCDGMVDEDVPGGCGGQL